MNFPFMYYLVLLADKFQKAVRFISLSNFSTLCLFVPTETDAHILTYVLCAHIRW